MAAAKMAVKAGMSVDDAKAAMADMPKETPAAKEEGSEEQASGTQDTPLGSEPTPFGGQMTGTGVGATPQPAEGAEQGGDQSNDLLGALSMVTGETFGKDRKSA